MKNYEVWTEGYTATGENSKATFHGIFLGSTFKDAVYNYIKTLSKGSQQYFKENNSELRFWGCRFFDNEIDARKNYG